MSEVYASAKDAPTRSNAAVVMRHSALGVKGHTDANYARHLSAAGFYAVTVDAAYQGESGGSSRGVENPSQRAGDVRAAVSYFTTLPPSISRASAP
jgi:fermentation-respiration switch protein FrsA (DUF1100 family)